MAKGYGPEFVAPGEYVTVYVSKITYGEIMYNIQSDRDYAAQRRPIDPTPAKARAGGLKWAL